MFRPMRGGMFLESLMTISFFKDPVLEGPESFLSSQPCALFYNEVNVAVHM